MTKTCSAASALLGLILVACDSPPSVAFSASIPGYDLTRADASFDLPPELHEISALTDLDDQTVACVQDEQGFVFHLDLATGKVIRKLPFGGDGDYEGLTRIADSLWVLRSDGLMQELTPTADGYAPGRRLVLAIGHQDIEGLGYDAARRVILVSPKDPPEGGREARRTRQIFGVDPATGQPLARPVLSLTLERIAADAARLGIELPRRTNRRGKERIDIKLRFSSVAVHPQTDEIYLLSAADGALIVVDRAGNLRALHCFAAGQLPKAEGITFLGNGDMVLSSEGVTATPRLQVFRYRPAAKPPATQVPSSR